MTVRSEAEAGGSFVIGKVLSFDSSAWYAPCHSASELTAASLDLLPEGIQLIHHESVGVGNDKAFAVTQNDDFLQAGDLVSANGFDVDCSCSVTSTLDDLRRRG